MIKKEELVVLEDELIDKIFEREITRLEKQLIRDNDRSREVCEFLVNYEFEDKVCNKKSKKKLLDRINKELEESNYSFEFSDDVYFIPLNEKIDLNDCEKELYFAYTTITKKIVREIKNVKNKIKNSLDDL